MLRASRRGALGVAIASFLVGVVAAPAIADHYYRSGWRDKHIGYPGTPDGYQQIVNRFGPACSSDANKIWMNVRAADNGQVYTVRFHKRLGGLGTGWVSDKGGTSTNLDNDVRGHIGNDHLDQYVLSGIWGYNCRYIAGTRKWSTHAWGIAVDVSSAYEPNGQCYSRVNYRHWPIWREHRWKWGKSWCDAMHFQYATSY